MIFFMPATGTTVSRKNTWYWKKIQAIKKWHPEELVLGDVATIASVHVLQPATQFWPSTTAMSPIKAKLHMFVAQSHLRNQKYHRCLASAFRTATPAGSAFRLTHSFECCQHFCLQPGGCNAVKVVVNPSLQLDLNSRRGRCQTFTKHSYSGPFDKGCLHSAVNFLDL